MNTARRPLRPGKYKPDGPPDHARLYPMANAIRTAYIRAYRAHFYAHHGVPSSFGARPVPRWDGGEAADGCHYRPVWYGLAQLALDLGVGPEDLINGAFHGWDSKDPPWPTRLGSPETVAYVTAHPGTTVEDVQVALKVQKETWRTEIFFYRRARGCSFEEAARATLRNLRLEFSSMFRYCMAADNEDDETAALFAEGALLQYVFHRKAYDGGWGDLIPARLRALADQLNPAGG